MGKFHLVSLVRSAFSGGSFRLRITLRARCIDNDAVKVPMSYTVRSLTSEHVLTVFYV